MALLQPELFCVAKSVHGTPLTCIIQYCRHAVNGIGGTAAVRVAQQTCMVNNNEGRFVSSVNEN